MCCGLVSHVLQEGQDVGNHQVHPDYAVPTHVAFLLNAVDIVVFVVHVAWHTRWLGFSALPSMVLN